MVNDDIRATMSDVQTCDDSLQDRGAVNPDTVLSARRKLSLSKAEPQFQHHHTAA